MSIHNYELLSVLDKDKHTNSKIFKVKDKACGDYYVWHVIDAQSLSKQQMGILEEKFKLRKGLKHPNLLDFCEIFKEVESNLYYLVVKYCRHGSLKDLMDLAFRDSSRVCEEFLCKILYQIALVVKTITVLTKFDIKNVFFDEDYNVKLLNFEFSGDSIKMKNPTTSSLGVLIFEVFTLTKFKKGNFEKELKNYTHLYSKEFLSMITSMIKESSDLKKTIDKILCNSTLLLKATLWNKYKLLFKINDTNSCLQITEKTDNEYAIQVEKLREKELILQRKERELKIREHKLTSKEKKVAIMEKKLKDSIKKASEEFVKYNSNIQCNCKKAFTAIDQKAEKENLDSTYISCGDSVIVPTSKKLNVNEIIKPATFTRTLSEKRIRFKGHSPLKDIGFNRRSSVKHPKSQKCIVIKNTNSEWMSCSDDTDRSSLTYHKATNKTGKQLFHTYANNAGLQNDAGAKPIQWTEENKRHAFELLRIMNNDEENKPPDVKHTYL